MSLSKSRCQFSFLSPVFYIQSKSTTDCRLILGSRLRSKKKKVESFTINGYNSWCKNTINKCLIDNSASCWSQDIQWWFLHILLVSAAWQADFFFQNGDLKFTQMANTHPVLASLTEVTLPHMKGVPPIFFGVKMTARGCSLEYLDGFGHFLFGFVAAGTNSRGGL